TIWQLRRQVWPTSFGPWPDVSLGLILGCSSIALPLSDDEWKTGIGPFRLLRTLLLESAHLIWVPNAMRVQGTTTN
ncbi:hypothetical protein SCLCIDRAFT_136876, partial [Scleroderma citrinum Foug A]